MKYFIDSFFKHNVGEHQFVICHNHEGENFSEQQLDIINFIKDKDPKITQKNSIIVESGYYFDVKFKQDGSITVKRYVDYKCPGEFLKETHNGIFSTYAIVRQPSAVSLKEKMANDLWDIKSQWGDESVEKYLRSFPAEIALEIKPLENNEEKNEPDSVIEIKLLEEGAEQNTFELPLDSKKCCYPHFQYSSEIEEGPENSISKEFLKRKEISEDEEEIFFSNMHNNG